MSTEEEIYQAVYFPETIKWETKEQQEFWDKITNLTSEQCERIWEKIENEFS